MASPKTPVKRRDDELNLFLRNINVRWGLNLPVREEDYSPSQVARSSPCREQCTMYIKYLFFQDRQTLYEVIDSFGGVVNKSSPGWTVKPLQEGGTLPGLSAQERLTVHLLDHIKPEFERVKNSPKKTLSRPRWDMANTALVPKTPPLLSQTGLPHTIEAGSPPTNGQKIQQQSPSSTKTARTAGSARPPTRREFNKPAFRQQQLDFQSVAPSAEREFSGYPQPIKADGRLSTPS